MNDEKEVGHRSEESAASDPTEPTGKLSADAQSGGEAQTESNTLEIETFIDDRERELPRDRSGLRTSAGTTSESSRIQHEPPRWGELFGVFCLIVLCDLTLYRGEGFAGYALLFFVAPLLLWLSSIRRRRGSGLWIVSAMLAALAVKMVWCGSIALVAVGVALIVVVAMTVAGMTPYVLEAMFFASQILQGGYLGIIQYFRQINQFGVIIPRAAWISVALPLLALFVFGWIFVLANPDFVISFGEGMQRVFDVLRDWIVWFSPDFLEAGFWFVTLWVILGLLRPVLNQSNLAEPAEDAHRDDDSFASDSFLYPAFRNTLVTVIVLFAIYLVFEFKRMWIGEFPDGFYYSGFAHAGAAWLTTALALATVLLSLVFRGSILRDRRLCTLRRLTWLWSLENLLLAAAVYNRLFIYVGFNGMSRMRIVGFYGISAVVVGFIWVLWKIARNRKFLWLLRRQLWTLAVALYLLALTPMDRFVVGYNVRRILEGDPAPSVQISVHSINSEGILLLLPLLESDDAMIREGVQALLAEQHIKAESTATRRNALGWTTYQIADRIALEAFRKNSSRWERYFDLELRQETLERFHEYAYQWY